MKKMIKLGGGVLEVKEGVGGGNEGGDDHIPLYVCVIYNMYVHEITKGQKKGR